MLKYIGKKVLIAIATVFVLATATFFLMKLIPGDPFLNDKIPVAVQDKQRAFYGLDKPVPQQYLTYMNNLLHGDLGYSIKKTGKTVVDIIKEAFPVSAKLGLISLLFARGSWSFLWYFMCSVSRKMAGLSVDGSGSFRNCPSKYGVRSDSSYDFWCKAWHPSGNRMGKNKSDYPSCTCSWSWNCCRKYKKYESEHVSHNNAGLCKDGKSERSFPNSRRIKASV